MYMPLNERSFLGGTVTTDRFRLAESSAEFERKSPSKLGYGAIFSPSSAGYAGTCFALAPARIQLFLSQEFMIYDPCCGER
jgi:mevalonate pyrophosphate decarboxylase